MTWESKIVKHSKESPSSLTGNPLNFRTHPKKQSDAVADSIREIGFVKSILVNEQTGYVLDGHERLWQALKQEERNPGFKVDVEWVSLPPELEALALAVLDPSSEMAGVDLETLDALLREISTGSEALNDLINSIAEDLVDSSETAEEAEGVEDDPPPAMSEDSVIQIMSGDVASMNVDGNLVQIILPTATVNEIFALIIDRHGEISVQR